MPRKLRRPKPRPQQPLTVGALSFDELADFTCAWEPGPSAIPRQWATWLDYLDAYEEIRDELLATERLEPFAERVRRYRHAYGAAALLTADYTDIKASDPDAA
jgi:hypothetical protein